MRFIFSVTYNLLYTLYKDILNKYADILIYLLYKNIFRSVAAASMIQCLYMPPPNWHIIDDIALNKDRGKAKEDFVSDDNKKNTVENRSFQIWREFVEGRVSNFEFLICSRTPLIGLKNAAFSWI